jgi:uncharacterized protein (TIGR00251 family)
MDALRIDVRAGSLRVNVHVQPRASRNEIAGLFGTALKVRLQAPPVEGAANDALVALFAERLGVPRRSVRVVAGASSRGKIIEIEGTTEAAVRALIAGAGTS